MRISIPGTAFFLWLTLAAGPSPALAQEPAPADEADSSSQQVEESDEEFRRRMELEDARARDLGYPAPVDTPAKDLEKIDKLPEKSQNNIRDQLVDVIVENGEWEPFDALREYPYEPTAAAQADPDLLQREQEAWDEQVQKYHDREAAAFGARRGPVPGPGNPTGQEGGAAQAEAGGEPGAGGEGAEQGDAQGEGQEGGQESGQGSGEGEAGGGQAGSSGTYEPYESSRSRAEDEVSTAGAQQSALDFLRGQQGQAPGAASAPAPAAGSAPGSAAASTDAAAAQAATSTSAGAAAGQAGEAPSESASEADPEQEAQTEVTLDTRGIIPIEDLDKLEGTELPAEPAQPAERDDSEQPQPRPWPQP